MIELSSAFLMGGIFYTTVVAVGGAYVAANFKDIKRKLRQK